MSVKRAVYQQKIKYFPYSSYVPRKKSKYNRSVGLRRWLVGKKKKLIVQTYRVEKVFTL